MEPTSKYGTFPEVVEMDEEPAKNTLEQRVSKVYILREVDFNNNSLDSTIKCTIGGIGTAVSIAGLGYVIYRMAAYGEIENQRLIGTLAFTLAQGMLFFGQGMGEKRILWDASERNIPIQYV